MMHSNRDFLLLNLTIERPPDVKINSPPEFIVLPNNEIFDLSSNIDFLRKLNNPNEDQTFEY